MEDDPINSQSDTAKLLCINQVWCGVHIRENQEVRYHGHLNTRFRCRHENSSGS